MSVAAALLPRAKLLGHLVPSVPLPPCEGGLWVVALWALSRQARNRLQHALHGNGGPAKGPAGGKGPQGFVSLTPRQLQEPQTVAALRAAGWSLPPAVRADVAVRVYETRMDPAYLTKAAVEACPLGPARLEFVGGDFGTTRRPSTPRGSDLGAQGTGRRATWSCHHNRIRRIGSHGLASKWRWRPWGLPSRCPAS
jgi:hypothetical protein